METEALECFGGEEHAGGDGAEGDKVADEAVGEGSRKVDVFPCAKASGGIGHEVKIHPVEVTPGRDGPEPADDEAIAEASEIGVAVEATEQAG